MPIHYPVVHDNLHLIEVAEAQILDDLLADPITAGYILNRLSERVAIVAPDKFDIILNRLLKQGHTPKVLD